MLAVVFERVALGLKNVAATAVPHTSPILVGPTQHERKVRLPRPQYFLEWPFEESLTVEPVVVIAEAVDAVTSGKRRLRFASLGKSQVVEAQIPGEVWLVVPTKP